MARFDSTSHLSRAVSWSFGAPGERVSDVPEVNFVMSSETTPNFLPVGVRDRFLFFVTRLFYLCTVPSTRVLFLSLNVGKDFCSWVGMDFVIMIDFNPRQARVWIETTLNLSKSERSTLIIDLLLIN